jgi:hypothetical protein
MSEHEQDEARDKTSELISELPFISEFPFSEYDIKLIERGDDFIKLGISPILVDEFGDNGTIEHLNFNYTEGDSNISISIARYDVEWVAEQSSKVKKLDAIRKILDDGISGKSLLNKVKAIKKGQKFIDSIDCDNVALIDFRELLSEFLLMYDTALISKTKVGLQKLSEATLKSTEFSERQFKAVSAYLNFQIHYTKILLGIIIAAKIY